MHGINSDICLGINTVSDSENLVFSTLDWDHVSNDPVCEHHHVVFTCFHDAETCQSVDPDGLYPFCLVSKLNADNCLSFKEILQMDKELRDKWFDAMDKELQDLFKSGAFKFVSWGNMGFPQKRHPSGEVI